MIITTIKIQGNPAKRKEIVLTVEGLTEKMRKSAGCLRADLYQDLENKDTFYILEEWQTIKDLENYKASKSMAVLLGTEPLLTGALEIKYAVKLFGRKPIPVLVSGEGTRAARPSSPGVMFTAGITMLQTTWR